MTVVHLPSGREGKVVWHEWEYVLVRWENGQEHLTDWESLEIVA